MAQSEDTKSQQEDNKKHLSGLGQIERDNSIPDLNQIPYHAEKLERAKKALVRMGGTLCD
jgi:hypothetical protein